MNKIICGGKEVGTFELKEWINWDIHTLEPVYIKDKNGNTEVISLEVVVRQEYILVNYK